MMLDEIWLLNFEIFTFGRSRAQRPAKVALFRDQTEEKEEEKEEKGAILLKSFLLLPRSWIPRSVAK